MTQIETVGKQRERFSTVGIRKETLAKLRGYVEACFPRPVQLDVVSLAIDEFIERHPEGITHDRQD